MRTKLLLIYLHILYTYRFQLMFSFRCLFNGCTVWTLFKLRWEEIRLCSFCWLPAIS